MTNLLTREPGLDYLTVDDEGRSITMRATLTELRKGHEEGRRPSSQTNQLPPPPGNVHFLDADYREQFFRYYKITGIPNEEKRRFSDPTVPLLLHFDVIAEEVPMLLLFNVMVALEWVPTSEEKERLEIAFCRASDFLYDVTEGYMAFGQVIIGGSAFMDGADIQIFSSNRLYPRAGLKKSESEEDVPDAGSEQSESEENLRVLPVRLGRQLTHRRLNRSIGWELPEGYRLLIHEWAHYALGLRDRYLKKRPSRRRDSNREVVVPIFDPDDPSIMAHLLGDRIGVNVEGSFLEKLIDDIRGSHRVGPGELPFHLPRVYFVEEDPSSPAGCDIEPPRELNEALYRYCDVYVLKWVHKGERIPSQLIASGSLDSLTVTDPEDQINSTLYLPTAQDDDTVVLIVQEPEASLRVWRGECPDEGDHKVVDKWRDVTPPVIPQIAAIPLRQEETSPRHPDSDYPYKVKVKVIGKEAEEPRRWLFERGGNKAHDVTTGPSDKLTVLDGHVVVLWDDALWIAPFSQGGIGPGDGGINGDAPPTAGSGDGMARIFFVKEYGGSEEPQDPTRMRAVAPMVTLAEKLESSLRVLTTRNVRQGDRGGPLYTLAASDPLSVLEMPNTTLVLYRHWPGLDDLDRFRRSEPIIFRGDQKELTPDYIDPLGPYVALRLTESDAPGLFNSEDEERIESFYLVWESDE